MNSDAVVLVHGTRASAGQWDRQVPSLCAAGYRVVVPDLPGHGARRGEPFTLPAALEAVTEAVRIAARMRPDGTSAAGEQPGGGVHLVGSSLGGMLAIRIAAEHPEHLASLTALGASVQPSPRTAALYGRAILAADRLPGMRSPTRGRLLRMLLGREGARAYLRGGRAGAEVVAPSMEAAASLDLLSNLRRTEVPVTILNPRFDQLRGQERQFAAAAPRGRLVVLPYGTHLANLNRAERFTADLLRVLATSRTAS